MRRLIDSLDQDDINSSPGLYLSLQLCHLPGFWSFDHSPYAFANLSRFIK